MSPDSPTLACLYTHTYKSDIHVTRLLQILATGLLVLHEQTHIAPNTLVWTMVISIDASGPLSNSRALKMYG